MIIRIMHVALESIYTEDRKGRQLCRSVILDLTDHVRAEEALQESEKRFRLLAETSIDVIFQIDPEGNILYTSPSAGV